MILLCLVPIFAGIATDVIYSFNDNLPYAENILPITYGVTSGAMADAIFTTGMTSFKYQIAIDNYNMNLLGIE